MENILQKENFELYSAYKAEVGRMSQGSQINLLAWENLQKQSLKE